MPEGESEPRFDALGLSPTAMAAIAELGFTTPTPIQAEAIPVGLTGRDIIGIAQTGTGKTLAFGLPMLERLAGTTTAGMVLLPTRELALQVEETLARVGQHFGVKTVVLIGGAPFDPQLARLRQNPQIVIATPGRLLDHLGQGNLRLDGVGVAVLDEADRMLDMGFAPDINRIMRQVPSRRQTMLFSATMPAEIARMARQYLVDPQRIEVAPAGTPAELVSHELYMAERFTKNELLARILVRFDGSVLIFTRTRAGARRLTRNLDILGYNAAEIHSDRSQLQRQAALSGFKSGKYRILVATDIAARGIDVKGIELVVNYDLPDNPDDYVHRIGRTGRAGLNGHAISLVLPAQGPEVRAIEKAVGMWLPLADEGELPDPQRPHRAPAEPPAALAVPGPAVPGRRRRRRRTHREPGAEAVSAPLEG